MPSKLSLALSLALLLISCIASAQTPGAPIASQETNWNGVTAEVTEFKRKGNTLTVKVRLKNGSTAKVTPHIDHRKNYLLDASAGKKYEVLKDDQGVYVAALTGSSPDAFGEDIPASQSKIVWMKFPAPPATTKAATLHVDGVPPFEDLPITDQ
jgi:hypothetical protein